MGENSKIEWCLHTFNPWIGCTRISNGDRPSACDNCYAAAMSHRYGWATFEAGAPRHRTTAENWKQPLRWNRKAEATGTRARVFGPSLGDPFDTEVPDDWRRDYLELIEATPSLDWILLTKRPQVAVKFFAGRAVPDNLWPGITAETQPMLNLRAPAILSIKAKVHVLSAEPLLGPLDLAAVDINGHSETDVLRPISEAELWAQDWAPDVTGTSLEEAIAGFRDWGCHYPPRDVRPNGFGWVIAGGESGPRARPSHPDWLRSLRDQCAAASVPWFFKQWGSWHPVFDRDRDDPDWRRCDRVARETPNGRWLDLAGGQGFHGERVVRVDRISKKLAGAKLDGVEHREFPR